MLAWCEADEVGILSAGGCFLKYPIWTGIPPGWVMPNCVTGGECGSNPNLRNVINFA